MRLAVSELAGRFQPLHGAQVDEDVRQGVAVGNGGLVAQLGSLDTQGNCLAEDPLDSGALFVDLLVGIAFPVQLVANTSAGEHGHGELAAPFGPARVVDWAGLVISLQRTAKATAAMLDQRGAVDEGAFAGHGQASGAEGRAVYVKQAIIPFLT